MYTFNNLPEKAKEQVEKDALEACEHMNPDMLTEDQKLAIAVIAGANWVMGGEFGTNPVIENAGITVQNGKWHVVHRT